MKHSSATWNADAAPPSPYLTSFARSSFGIIFGNIMTMALPKPMPSTTHPPTRSTNNYPLSAHPNDGLSSYGGRDVVGYAGNPPKVRWPNGAKVAVNIVLNYEEGERIAYCMAMERVRSC